MPSSMEKLKNGPIPKIDEENPVFVKHNSRNSLVFLSHEGHFPYIASGYQRWSGHFNSV